MPKIMGRKGKSGCCGGNGGYAALADGFGDLQRLTGAVARGEHAGQVGFHPAIHADERAVHLKPRQQRGERCRLAKDEYAVKRKVLAARFQTGGGAFAENRFRFWPQTVILSSSASSFAPK